MATLPEYADNIGKEIHDKRLAERAAKAAAAKEAEQKAKAQEDHKNNKEQGMI